MIVMIFQDVADVAFVFLECLQRRRERVSIRFQWPVHCPKSFVDFECRSVDLELFFDGMHFGIAVSN